MSELNEKWPTVAKLTAALKDVGAPKSMVEHAEKGQYHDFISDSATPIVDLVNDCMTFGIGSHLDAISRAPNKKLLALGQAAANGDFDATREESALWFKIEGRATLSGN